MPKDSVKSKNAAARNAAEALRETGDTTLDLLATFVQTLRTLHLAKGGHQPWVNLDMTMAQFKSVVLLVFTGGMTSRQLADQLGVGPSAVTQLVDKLVDQKMAKREADETDRRVSWVRPTAKAIGLHDSLMQTSRELLVDVLEGLPARDRALVEQALVLLLGRAQGVLNAHRP